MTDNFFSRRFTVTGARGFLGAHLLRKLRQRGAEHVAIADRPEFDLTRPEDLRRLYDQTKPDVVIHLAPPSPRRRGKAR